MSERKRVDPQVEASVLSQSARRCALCFHLDRDLSEKLGQIAHLDHDPSNGCEDNLAFLCMPHHSQYDSRTSQHKNYTIAEVKEARSKLYREIEARKPCEWWLVLDGKFSSFDKDRIDAVLQHLKTILEDPHITIKGIESGSVRLLIESSQSAYENIRRLVRTGAQLKIGDLTILEVERKVAAGRGVETFPPKEPVERGDESEPLRRPAFWPPLPGYYSGSEPVAWFDQFFNEQRPRLVYLFASRGVPMDVAEDLAEDTFLRFLNFKPGPKPYPAPYPVGLLWNIAHRVLRESYRRGQREVPIEDLPESIFTTGSPVPQYEMAEELHLVLDRAMSKLTPKERAVLTFRFLNWPTADILAALDMHANQFDNHFYNALRKLRRIREGMKSGE